MDAKAKVVAWHYTDRDGMHKVALHRAWEGELVNELIPLTDHEAALAELRSRQREWLCRKCSTVFPEPSGLPPMGMGCKCGNGLLEPTSLNERLLQDEVAAANARNATLLTGLEALAKRMYADAEDKDRHYEWKCCCDLYGGLLMTLHASTLASAGLEGKGNG